MTINELRFRTIWSGVDKKYIGVCFEHFPLTYAHEDKDKALEGIKELVKELD